MYWLRIRELTNNMFIPMQVVFNPETEWMIKWENFMWLHIPNYHLRQFRYAFN